MSSAKPLGQATEWLEKYRKIWEAQFARLDDLLEELKAHEKARPKRKPTKR